MTPSIRSDQKLKTQDTGSRIGRGLPTQGNVHEIAQQVIPTPHVVYVDNDRCKSGCTHPLLGLHFEARAHQSGH
jgi:hypothetical protein